MTKTMIKPEKTTQKKPLKEITEELMKSQIYLFQLCHDLQQKVGFLELELQKMSIHAQHIMQENGELKEFLNHLSKKLMNMKKDGAEDNTPNIPSSDPRASRKIGKIVPLHDDVSITCKICEHIYHIHQKACPKCSYREPKKSED